MSIEPARVNGTMPQVAPVATEAVAAGAEAEQARQEQVHQDVVRRRNEAAQRAAAVLGNIVSVMMHTPGFAGYSVGDLRWLVVPAVATGQYSLAQGRVKATGELRTVGVLLWASVADAVDARLMTDPQTAIRLSPDEWLGGNNLWVVEGIGERGVIAQQIRQLRQKDWKGRPVKIKVLGQDGAPLVRQLPAG